MLCYYFGGKDDLFLAVLERAHEHIRVEEQALHLEGLPLVAMLSWIFGRDLKSRPALAQRLDHVTDIIVVYVARHRAAGLRRTVPRGYADRLSG